MSSLVRFQNAVYNLVLPIGQFLYARYTLGGPIANSFLSECCLHNRPHGLSALRQRQFSCAYHRVPRFMGAHVSVDIQGLSDIGELKLFARIKR